MLTVTSYSLVLYMPNINPLVIYLSFFMYTGNNLDIYDKGKLIFMLQLRQLSLVTSHKMFLGFISVFFVNIVIPTQLPIKGVWPVQG